MRVRNLRVGALTFDADFDSGNCASVEHRGEHEYAVWTAPDCDGTECETNFRSWFYFSVRGVLPGSTLHFSVHNMNAQGKLFKHDFRPVYRALPSRPQWERLRSPVATSGNKAEDNFVLHFRHTVECKTADLLFFAFSYPHGYDECLERLARLDALFGLPPMQLQQANGPLLEAAPPPASDLPVPSVAQLIRAAAANEAMSALPKRRPTDVYYVRELLTISLDGRRVELLTVSGTNGMLSELEPPLPGLFPCGTDRPHTFEGKRVFFLSARVHPGEVPASHVFNGFVEFLMRENDPRARLLRELYVFKLVPILNPDGVHNGHYRADTMGTNLNRLYLDATPERQPSIWAVVQVLRQLSEVGKLRFFVDLHAHANKRGCFMFGNALPYERQVETVLYAKLVAVNSHWFDFGGCDFSAKGMHRRDRREGLSKEGSARVGVYTHTDCTFCYALECNYNMGKIVNKLQPTQALPKGQQGSISPPASPPRGSELKYSPASWRDVGKAVAIAVLDLDDLNPATRLGPKGSDGLAKLRSTVTAWVRTQTRKQVAKPAAKAASDDGEGHNSESEPEDDEEENTRTEQAPTKRPPSKTAPLKVAPLRASLVRAAPPANKPASAPLQPRQGLQPREPKRGLSTGSAQGARPSCKPRAPPPLAVRGTGGASARAQPRRSQP